MLTSPFEKKDVIFLWVQKLSVYLQGSLAVNYKFKRIQIAVFSADTKFFIAQRFAYKKYSKRQIVFTKRLDIFIQCDNSYLSCEKLYVIAIINMIN